MSQVDVTNAGTQVEVVAPQQPVDVTEQPLAVDVGSGSPLVVETPDNTPPVSVAPAENVVVDLAAYQQQVSPVTSTVLIDSASRSVDLVGVCQGPQGLTGPEGPPGPPGAALEQSVLVPAGATVEVDVAGASDLMAVWDVVLRTPSAMVSFTVRAVGSGYSVYGVIRNGQIQYELNVSQMVLSVANLGLETITVDTTRTFVR